MHSSIEEIGTCDSRLSIAMSVLDAINRSQALIEFDLTGNITHANQNFLDAMGYTLDEIVGKHHRMFCTPEFAASDEYRDLWLALAAGRPSSGEYMRLHKDGRPVWLQASYNPVMDPDGRPFKVIKFATDITEQTLRNADFEGKMMAVDRAQAEIEFDLTGRILHANDNFLKTMGYERDEVVGKHHSIF